MNPAQPACTTPVVIPTVHPSASELRKREESASATGPDPRRSSARRRTPECAPALPRHHQNRIWLAITALASELLVWCARLALPATVPGYEPKRMRLRISPPPDGSCAPHAGASCASTRRSPALRRRRRQPWSLRGDSATREMARCPTGCRRVEAGLRLRRRRRRRRDFETCCIRIDLNSVFVDTCSGELPWCLV